MTTEIKGDISGVHDVLHEMIFGSRFEPKGPIIEVNVSGAHDFGFYDKILRLVSGKEDGAHGVLDDHNNDMVGDWIKNGKNSVSTRYREHDGRTISEDFSRTADGGISVAVKEDYSDGYCATHHEFDKNGKLKSEVITEHSKSPGHTTDTVTTLQADGTYKVHEVDTVVTDAGVIVTTSDYTQDKNHKTTEGSQIVSGVDGNPVKNHWDPTANPPYGDWVSDDGQKSLAAKITLQSENVPHLDYNRLIPTPVTSDKYQENLIRAV